MKKRIVYEDDDHNIVKEEVKNYASWFDDEKGYLFKPRGGAFKRFFNVPFPNDMNDMEIGRLMRLASLMWQDSNMIGYKGHGGIKAYDIAGMAKALGKRDQISTRQMERFVKKMMALGVMAKTKVETLGVVEIQYYINPLYAFGGTRVNNTLYTLFHKSIDKYIPEWARKKFIGSNKEVFKEVFKPYVPRATQISKSS